MGKSIIILSITVLFICGIHTSEDEKLGARNKRFGLDIGKPVEFLNSAKNILREVYDVWHVMLRQPNLKVTDAVFRSKEHEILGRLMTVSQQVAKLDEKLDSTSSTTINTLLLTFPNVVRLELRLHELGKMIAQINLADEQLRRYLIHGYQNETVEEVEIQPLQAEMFNLTEAIDNEVFDPKVNYRIARGTDRDPDRKWLIEEHTLQNFAQWATGHNSDSIPSLLGRIHMMISPDDKNFLSLGIFNLIKENANVSKNVKVKLS